MMYIVGRENNCWECSGQYLYGPFDTYELAEEFIEAVENWWRYNWYINPTMPQTSVVVTAKEGDEPHVNLDAYKIDGDDGDAYNHKVACALRKKRLEEWRRENPYQADLCDSINKHIKKQTKEASELWEKLKDNPERVKLYFNEWGKKLDFGQTLDIKINKDQSKE